LQVEFEIFAEIGLAFGLLGGSFFFFFGADGLDVVDLIF
jgi:hypothetical protein